MKLYLLLITLTIVNAGVVTDPKCNGVIIDGNYYDKETIKNNLSVPYLLAVDHTSNIIYFSYNFNEVNENSALIDLNTKEFKDINDVRIGFTQAVDQNTHDVYIGGDDGIYKYDYKNHKSELYAAKDKDVYRVFFKDVLYFSEFPSQFMYTYIDGNIARFKDLEETKTKEFVIDGEDVMFYTNDTGLYAQTKGTKDAVLYSNKLDVRALAVDVHGNAYMCTIDTIYKIDKKSSSLKKLMDVNDCWGLAFDKNNNMIYSNTNSLVRLKFDKDKKC